MDWTKPARTLHDQVRGLIPWPSATAELNGVKCKIFATAVLDETTGKAPGSVLAADKKGLKIACGEGTVLRIDTLQAAGDLSIRFEISGIDGVTGDFSIKGYEEKEGGNVATEKYSSVSWKNADANKPLITAINVDRTSFETDAELDIPETALTPGTGQGGLKKAGSFTIRTQELGGEADATVVLTLVIKYGENMEQEMQIPYTIQIRNYEKQQQP